MSFPVPVKYGTDEIEYSDEKTISFPPGGEGSSGNNDFACKEWKLQGGD